MKKALISTFIFCLGFLSPQLAAFAQRSYQTIPLPLEIASVNEEFSGLSSHKGRLYLIPQYGSYKETKLEGIFNIYSILTDSITRVIEGKDKQLTAFKTIKVKNLALLPDEIKSGYEGFEAITFIGDEVYLSIETHDDKDYCYLIKGILNTKLGTIEIDAVNFMRLARYPYVENAGYEALTYLPEKKKLLAIYEYNAMHNGGIGYLIDPSFKKAPEKIDIPFLPFRITDIQIDAQGTIYGINYFWNGDYKAYLDNEMFRNAEKEISKTIPDLKAELTQNGDYLKKKTTSYSRIVRLSATGKKQWEAVRSFPSDKNNWEGMVLFRKGALVISDANRSDKQVTTLAYFDFK
ncbi:hypothetical protein [Pedobacter duraquae]|uniref:Uncharacterized protein n=1 Tax=Pedobacter duraquae TaxID=425511 RepID=A0A4R6IIN1_9SPHI|nr:hypothetical protein [Pedobacter duraquae]TDO21842.1 hypothetical protein CLV32_2950 [Pedobacter duraquae]